MNRRDAETQKRSIGFADIAVRRSYASPSWPKIDLGEGSASDNFCRPLRGLPDRGGRFAGEAQLRRSAIAAKPQKRSKGLVYFAFCLFTFAFVTSCGSKPTDMRSLVPAETLVYLETNELAAALQPIVDAKPFMEVAKSKPDFSALKGVQLAVAVTGFETSEEKLTDEHSVGRVQPRFVAVADTHAWNSNAVAFAEKKLGSFVANIYDSEPTIEKTDKHGGKYFTWAATDGRKAYALVIDSLIYFGNDESAIEKCLAVKRGETDSILKTGKIPVASPEILASGYVSTDGIAQIANIVGLKFASEAADESEVQSAIAGVLPQLLRNSVTDMSWTTTKTVNGFEDKYSIELSPEISTVFHETLSPSADTEAIDIELFQFVTANSAAVTVYNLKEPKVAWRSILLAANSRTDVLGARVLGEFAGMVADPYGIRDPEMFLSGLNGKIISTRLNTDAESVALFAKVTNSEMVLRSLTPDFTVNETMSQEFGAKVLSSDDVQVLVAFVGTLVIAGDTDAVVAALKNRSMGENELRRETIRIVSNWAASPSISVSTDRNIAWTLAHTISPSDLERAVASSRYITETRFTKTGIDRRTTSDFGLIGSIIVQLGGNE